MTVIVNGIAVNYHDSGKGKVIFLLHGWESDAQAFSSLARKLSRNYRVILPDLPGFGETEMPQKNWDLDSYINFVKDLADKLNIKKIYGIVAHSMGGRIAIKGVGGGMLPAERLVLIGAHGIRESRSFRNRLFLMAAKTGKFVTKPLPQRYRQRLRERLYKTAGSRDYLDAGEMRQILTKIVSEDVRPEAAMISVPTLLIYGQNDTLTPPHYGKIFEKLIVGSTLKVIPGAGHFAHHDQAGLVETLIEQFFK
jgi:pimeloyl-ACP methyl ester carboxylesterase